MGWGGALCSPIYPRAPLYLWGGPPGKSPSTLHRETHSKEKAKQCTFEEEMLQKSLCKYKNIKLIRKYKNNVNI